MLDSLSSKKVLVVGDSILDVTVSSEAIGLSLESPTLKAQKIEKQVSFGGCANVVKNMLELGAQCTFITLLGRDEYKSHYDKWAHENLTLIPVSEDRINTVKERYWVSRAGTEYKVFQLNQGDSYELNKKSETQITNIFSALIHTFDIVVLVDYRKGLFSKGLTQNLINICNNEGIPVISSSQISDNEPGYNKFKNSSLICMNRSELAASLRYHICKDEYRLSKELKSDLCITLGSEGSKLIVKNKEYVGNPIYMNETDPTGAGDSFLACLALCDYKNSPIESLKLSNILAGLSVTKKSTNLVSRKEFIDYVCSENTK